MSYLFLGQIGPVGPQGKPGAKGDKGEPGNASELEMFKEAIYEGVAQLVESRLERFEKELFRKIHHRRGIFG